MTRFTPQWLQAGTYAASEDRRLIGALWPAAASVGCQVIQSTGMAVVVNAGQVAVPTANQQTLLCSSDATETVNVAAAPPSGTNRIDLIVCQARGADVDGGANNDFIFTAVGGVPAASPVAPAVPQFAVALAQIYIAGGSAAIINANITDRRPGNLAIPVGAGPGSPALGYIASGSSATTVNVGATSTTIMTASWNAIAGRRYRVEFTYNGNQATAAGNVSIAAPTGNNPFFTRNGLPAGGNLTGQGSATVQATATGPMTLTCGAAVSAGNCSFAAGWNLWSVYDVGAAP